MSIQFLKSLSPIVWIANAMSKSCPYGMAYRSMDRNFTLYGHHGVSKMKSYRVRLWQDRIYKTLYGHTYGEKYKFNLPIFNKSVNMTLPGNHRSHLCWILILVWLDTVPVIPFHNTRGQYLIIGICEDWLVCVDGSVA